MIHIGSVLPHTLVKLLKYFDVKSATGAGAKCLSVPRALFLTPWWAGSDEQVDVLTFWRFLSPSLPTRDGR